MRSTKHGIYDGKGARVSKDPCNKFPIGSLFSRGVLAREIVPTYKLLTNVYRVFCKSSFRRAAFFVSDSQDDLGSRESNCDKIREKK